MQLTGCNIYASGITLLHGPTTINSKYTIVDHSLGVLINYKCTLYVQIMFCVSVSGDDRVLNLCDQALNTKLDLAGDETGVINIDIGRHSNVDQVNSFKSRQCQLELRTSAYWRFELEVRLSSALNTTSWTGYEFDDTDVES